MKDYNTFGSTNKEFSVRTGHHSSAAISERWAANMLYLAQFSSDWQMSWGRPPLIFNFSWGLFSETFRFEAYSVSYGI